MKIHENVLSRDLLNECIKELAMLENSHVWGISNIIWPPYLQEGLVGNVSMRSLSETTSLELYKALEKYFSKMDSDYEVSYLYYVWNKLAGIASHNDSHVSVGATLYLNKLWESNWGGLFVWKDKNEKKEYKFNAICPQQNMLIINDEHEMHLVTPTASTIPYPRITIQIWFERKEKK